MKSGFILSEALLLRYIVRKNKKIIDLFSAEVYTVIIGIGLLT